ncbi:uncharacterized protein LOC115948711 [Geospiza fortis]|uniref:Uncharacterized protein LOC115948711 n=1 Tax=Geospiza fortis TaxID=48883 RepID=A0A8N5EYG8_GEOFO|nr:uncharacterized protein LOC115948711 [Geospiza fortis]
MEQEEAGKGQEPGVLPVWVVRESQGWVQALPLGAGTQGCSRQCHLQAVAIQGSAIPGGSAVPRQCHPQAVPLPGSAVPRGQCHPQAVPLPGSAIPRGQCHPQAVPLPGSAIPRQCQSQAEPFPGTLLGAAASPGGFSTLGGRALAVLLLQARLRSCWCPPAAEGQGGDSSWLLWGNLSNPFGAILARRDTESSLAQPRAGTVPSDKPWEFVSSLCRKTKPQEHPDQPALPGARESCGGRRMRSKGLLWAGEGSLGSLVPSRPAPPAPQLAPGAVLTHSGHLQGYPSSEGPACLPAGSAPTGDTGTADRVRVLHLFPSSCLEVPGLGQIPHWMENCWPRNGG